ncbi:asparagine synthetase [Escherichia coli]|nr:asparagine synthetase [Escherichia coli]ORR99795.1 asparagine synthetase [Escherichia coli]ORS09593.1 asparagine synthetase [Escherichia coli]ORS13085.1 asparagine synthetase [Escherichia coli]ORS13235.1 asparagine synthetase [Escherichia coli]
MNKLHFVSNLAPVKYNHSIKPAKNYRFINKYILTPDLFSPIDNHHYVFLFFHRQIACAQCCFAAFF